MSAMLERCLDDLESRLDDEVESLNRRSWQSFCDSPHPGEIFLPPSRPQTPPSTPWPDVMVNDAIEDMDLMLLQQFGHVSSVLETGQSSRLNVRCNYGSSILPSVLGMEMFCMDRQLNTLPTSRPLGDARKVRELVDRGVPDPNSGLGSRVFECAGRFMEVLAKYPRIGANVEVYHPDCQGPMDVAEVVWGSEIFLGFYDDPALVRDLLELVAQTYEVFMRRWYSLVPPQPRYSAHWGWTHLGVLALRNDSLMNISPDTYVEFVRPIDQRLFDTFGGAGLMHFCGRGDHYIEQMSQMTGLSAIAMSQPHMNDMEVIYRHTVDKGIRLVGFRREWADKANRPLRGMVNCTPEAS